MVEMKISSWPMQRDFFLLRAAKKLCDSRMCLASYYNRIRHCMDE